ncbi:unnamed protein product, partial [Medioppia subpectinata]
FQIENIQYSQHTIDQTTIMGISCGATLIKYLLFLFNVIWLLLGGVILWLGFKIALWGGDLKEIWSSNLQTGAIVVLAAGFLIFILAFLGCCGAIKQNSCMLTTYGALILLLVVLQCVGAYFAFANKGKLEGEFTKALTDQFHKWNGSQDKDVQRSIQLVQQTFQCCGITDYAHEYGADVPSSCCDAYT